MILPVLNIPPLKIFVVDDQQVLSVSFFGSFREVERTSDHGFPIDDHDLVVSDSVGRVNHRRYPRMEQKIRRFVEDSGTQMLGGVREKGKIWLLD